MNFKSELKGLLKPGVRLIAIKVILLRFLFYAVAAFGVPFLIISYVAESFVDRCTYPITRCIDRKRIDLYVLANEKGKS